MEYTIIASDSSGNAHLYDNRLLVDIGVPYEVIEPYVHKIEYVYITHRHGDHFNLSTLKRLLSNRPSIKVLSHHDVVSRMQGIDKSNIVQIEKYKTYKLNNMLIHPIPLEHDVYNLGLKFFVNGKKALHATDTYTLDHILAKDYDYYFVERNHCEDVLKYKVEQELLLGKYSHGLKSQYNHISKQRLENWLKNNANKNSVIEYLHESSTYLYE